MAENLKYSRTVIRLVFNDRKSVEIKFPDGERLPEFYNHCHMIPAVVPIAKYVKMDASPEEMHYHKIETRFRLRRVEQACGWRYAHYYQIDT